MEEQTFRAYSQKQAQAYLSGRGQDNENLFGVICEHHASTGGHFGTLLDLGCGPGNSTRPIAKHFERAYGIDASEAMIATGIEVGRNAVDGETKTGGKVEYKVGRVDEDTLKLKEEGIEIDLIIAGMAAHWFDLPKFWEAAGRALKRGGTVALWQYPSLACFHPSMPNAMEATAILNRLIEVDTGEFEKPGNRICREAYHNLCMPWDVSPPVAGFSREGFKRMEWDREGKLSSGDHFFLGDKATTVQLVYEGICTSSMVQRWREGNPQLADTDEDVAVKAIKRVRELIGREEVIAGRDCVLLLFKKS
ncbi:uncharacterized protein KY384_008884 [Bacidia gigantensis]|uniref:uncharacterized protein n=1 Tax=Bacidia gigantensis TaxID=2732470 RepID=UPI001D052A29|nr:uncharacterized protein KY384_008884 [Bacidia gigantensis]KAG8525240.1 hypothetical protein KY384_008884 [Bacidia gigantensis]